MTGAGCWASWKSWVAGSRDAGEKVIFCFGFLSLSLSAPLIPLWSFPLPYHGPRLPWFYGIFVPTPLAYDVILVSVSYDRLHGWRERTTLFHLGIHPEPNRLPCPQSLTRVKSERAISEQRGLANILEIPHHWCPLLCVNAELSLGGRNLM